MDANSLGRLIGPYNAKDQAQIANLQRMSMQNCAFLGQAGMLGIGAVSQASYGMTKEQLEAINAHNQETTIRQDLEAYLKDWKE